jgi:hypothetical protein
MRGGEAIHVESRRGTQIRAEQMQIERRGDAAGTQAQLVIEVRPSADSRGGGPEVTPVARPLNRPLNWSAPV